MPRLLVVHHSPTASLRALTEHVVVNAAIEASAEDRLGADGYVLGTSANFG